MMALRIGLPIFLSAALLLPCTGIAEVRDDALFPLFREMAQGRTLPLPMGLRGVFYFQNQDMDAESIRLTVPPVPLSGLPALPPGLPADVAGIESEAYTANARMDLWLLPFLNLYGILGYVSGEVRAEGISLPGPSSPAIAALIPESFVLEYDGPVYGGGLTLAAGGGNWWASLDANYTWADLDLSDSSIRTLTVSPRAGIQVSPGGMKGRLWLGTMYQDIEEKQAGAVSFPLMNGASIPARYDVESTAEKPWNLLVGSRWDFSPRWNAALEVGFLGRVQTMASVEYRF